MCWQITILCLSLNGSQSQLYILLLGNSLMQQLGFWEVGGHCPLE